MDVYVFPERMKKAGAHVVHMVTLPVFYIVFMLVYRPFNAKLFFETQNYKYAFHVLMTMCIIIGVLVVMRLILIALRRKLNNGIYILWCFFEALMMSMFICLYVCLFHHNFGNYFEQLPQSIEIVSLTLVYPYLVLFFAYRINDLIIRSLQETEQEEKLKIYDER